MFYKKKIKRKSKGKIKNGILQCLIAWAVKDFDESNGFKAHQVGEVIESEYFSSKISKLNRL